MWASLRPRSPRFLHPRRLGETLCLCRVYGLHAVITCICLEVPFFTISVILLLFGGHPLDLSLRCLFHIEVSGSSLDPFPTFSLPLCFEDFACAFVARPFGLRLLLGPCAPPSPVSGLLRLIGVVSAPPSPLVGGPVCNPRVHLRSLLDCVLLDSSDALVYPSASERVAVDFPADSDRLQPGFRRHRFTSDHAITWQLQQLLPPSSLDCRNGSSPQLPRLISAANFVYVGSHAPSLAYPLITGEIASGSMFFGGMSSGRHAIDHTFSTTVAHFATVS
ncbi:uncharacterized protein LACBIDRAFT_311232 [Laccaria bicolor S238N-H82]|uniref:Predicted protein n=1 Tax=Laccaria bicolor (strain S238N-H82 / ATCC MYA-4686) TaxID=486041 RepID=B0CZI3_LACBS|nr:uncharacterized protein LACBIDRAFT_311232 [Laccaria bicolor S238N-H82]EDR12629.1 predicted protein [Laccaria bicolor S238N-H82]|eukprot:XP_001876893.1 predicted protein [Laccaria bicolor S238N-H82]